uniref:Uncharacterized protein n=1 Tax=Oryza punctata TaxID=4537 RepID=A0A0E0M945_ORYPU
MARRVRADSLPIAAPEVMARLSRRAATKRRVAELDVEAQPASGGTQGGCRRRGGGVLGADGVQFVTEEQHALRNLSDVERHPGGCFTCGGVDDSVPPPDGGFAPDSEDDASGGVPASDLPSDGGFVPDSEDEACGGVNHSELPPDGGFVPDSEDETSSGGPDSELPSDDGFVPNSEGEANSGVPDSNVHPDGGFVPDLEDQVCGNVHGSELPPDDGGVLDFEDEASVCIPASNLPPNGGFVHDSEGVASGGIHNFEQQPDNSLSSNLGEQHMDGIEQLDDGEKVAGLEDNADAAAGDEGDDEFAETREDHLYKAAGCGGLVLYFYPANKTSRIASCDCIRTHIETQVLFGSGGLIRANN